MVILVVLQDPVRSKVLLTALMNILFLHKTTVQQRLLPIHVVIPPANPPVPIYVTMEMVSALTVLVK